MCNVEKIDFVSGEGIYEERPFQAKTDYILSNKH